MAKRLPFIIILILLMAPAVTKTVADPFDGAHRTPAFVERDIWRHPAETLAFFEVAGDMTVVEIWPGAGWYTEILAPLMKAGTLRTAHFPAGIGVTFYDLSREKFEAKLAAEPDVYAGVIVSTFDPARGILEVPEGDADRVLTFRNVHNWLRNDSEARAFRLFFRALKPGGILGVVEHRAKAGTPREQMLTSGYMTEEYVIELAEKAGFVLEAKSDINANPADTTLHPAGVWTLPPTLRLGAKDRETYLKIGESDRMTLRFRKPAAQ
ncbi:MAG: methyltransferase [Gammaproteobacteria bacterium]|nr:MAG: methyltransferase [Gammaproteobacteria bacterium]